MVNVQWSMFNEIYSGGYCGGVPPLPIPNREVKPACADGTAMQCGRVGGRHFFKRSPESEMIQGFVFYVDSEKDCSGFRKGLFCIPKADYLLFRKKTKTTKILEYDLFS